MRARCGLGLVAICALGSVLRFAALGEQSFWYDEKVTVDLLHLSWGTLLGALPHSESTPPVYYLVASAWSKLFGASEVGLRSLSALAGTLTIPAAYAAGAALASVRAGLVAAALTAVNPFLMWYAQEARAYALATLLSALAVAFFARAVAPGSAHRRRELALWASCCCLALATHYFAIFLIAPMAAVLGWRPRERRAAWGAIAAVGLTIAALTPLVLSQQANGRAQWISVIPLHFRLAQLGQGYLIGFDAPARLACLLVGVALLGAAGLLLARRGDQRERRAAAVFGGLGGIGVVLTLAFALVGDDFLIARNTIPVLIPMLVAVACGLGAGRSGRAGLAATGVLCALGVGLVVAVDRTPSLQRPDWRGLARALGPPADTRLVVVPGGYRAQPLRLYLGPSAYLTGGNARVGEVDVVLVNSPRHRGCWWGAACSLPALTPPVDPPAPGFTLADERHRGLWNVLRYRVPTAAVVRAEQLWSWGRSGPGSPRALLYLQHR